MSLIPYYGTVGGQVTTDSVPDAFTFSDVTGQAVSSTMTSNTITIASCPDSAVVSITGGDYSKNSGSYTSSGGTAVTGDTFAVRHTSASTFDTIKNTTLTVGGVSDTFSATTVATPPTYTDITMVVTNLANVLPDGSFAVIEATSYHPANGNVFLVGGALHYLVDLGTTDIFQLATSTSYAMYLTGTMQLNYATGSLNAQQDINPLHGPPAFDNLQASYRFVDGGGSNYTSVVWAEDTTTITTSTQICRVLGAGGGTDTQASQAHRFYQTHSGHPTPGAPGTIASPGAGPFATLGEVQISLTGNGTTTTTTTAISPCTVLAYFS